MTMVESFLVIKKTEQKKMSEETDRMCEVVGYFARPRRTCVGKDCSLFV